MKKMNRFVAWIALLAILLSSFAFGEEIVLTEANAAVEAVAVVEEAPADTEAIAASEEASAEAALPATEELSACADDPDSLDAETAYSLMNLCAHADSYYNVVDDNTHEMWCNDCWQIVGEPQKHVYKDGWCVDCGLWNSCTHADFVWVSNGNGTHSSYCVNCGEPGGATWDCFPHCSNPSVCRDCGAAYTGNEEPGHTYSGKYIDLGSGKHAMECLSCGKRVIEEEHYIDCTESGKTACSACGSAYSGDNVGHETWDGEKENWVSGNDWQHLLICVNCREKLYNTAEWHTFVDRYCTKCGKKNNCRHSKISWNRQVEDTGDGIHHSIACNDCYEVVKLEEHTMSGGECLYCDAKGPCGHESTKWKDLGDGTHGEVCAYCEIKLSDKVEAHSAKCTSDSKQCSDCGAEVSGDAISHNYIYPYGDMHEYWVDVNYGQHALKCYDCYEVKPGSTEAHTIVDGVCTKNCYYSEYDHKCYDYCDSNSGFCYVCGKETTGVDHRGGGSEIKINEYFHGYYCERCDVYYDLSMHHNYCFNDGYCYEKEGSYCEEKVNPDYVPVEHRYNEATQDSRKPDYHYYTCIFCGETERELHNVSCTAGDTYCYDCGAYVEKGQKHESINYWNADPVVLPNDPGKHGWACECGEVFYPTAHNYLNGVCADCGFEKQGVTAIEFVPPINELAVGIDESVGLLITGAYTKISYRSSNSKVLAVDEMGVLTAKKAGSATITATVTGADGESMSAYMKVTVLAAPSKVTLPAKKLSLGVGETSVLEPTFAPKNAYTLSTWTSSNEAVVTVDESGAITAAGEGTATITIETYNGKKASCTVTVLGAPANLSVNITELTLNPKKSYTLKTEVTSASGNDCAGELLFETSNSDVVTVDAKGKITAKATGSAVVTISTYNGLAHEVQVKVYNLPKKVTLNTSKESLNKGETLQLIASIAADEATTFTWTSSSKKVASVDENGLVTTLAEGSATITVKTANGKKATCKLTVVDPYKPSGIELAESGTVILALGDTLALNASLQPASAQSELSWTSSNKKVATVDENGLVTPAKEGSATITVTTYNKKKDTVKVQVVDPKKVAAVELDVSGTVILALGDTLALNASLQPATAESALTWTSSSKKVAAVDENGLVTPIKEGTATITVTSNNKKKDTVKVQVVDPKKAAAVELCQSGTIELGMGLTLQLDATVLPATAETTLSWTSSNKKVATVDENGLVTAVKKGTATITVKTANGKKDTVKIKVVAAPAPSSVELEDG